MIPTRLGITLDDALKENSELANLRNSDETSRRIIETALDLEGAVRHASTHAAGVVISEDPLTDYVALQRSTSDDDDAPPTTQFAMGPVASVGLLKMDFLGLTNLTILDRAMALIAETRGEHLSLPEIPVDDPKTFDLLSSGETFGVFQLEGGGMRRNIRLLQPNSIADVSAMIALYRPGPMEHINTFVEAKHGRAAIQYPHEGLKDILEDTYGVIVYQGPGLVDRPGVWGIHARRGRHSPQGDGQEDPRGHGGGARQVHRRSATERLFSRTGDPHLRSDRAVRRIRVQQGPQHQLRHDRLLDGVLQGELSDRVRRRLLNAATGNSDKVGDCVREARRNKIDVLLPDVNHSTASFAIELTDGNRTAIRFGLAAVKNVGRAAVTPIVESRKEGGPFTSLEDFCRRVDFRAFNSLAMESLIKVGAFDSLGHRGGLVEASERIMALGQRQTRLRESAKPACLIFSAENSPVPIPEIEIPVTDDVNDRERTKWEKEMLGVELTESNFTRRDVHDVGPVRRVRN